MIGRTNRCQALSRPGPRGRRSSCSACRQRDPGGGRLGGWLRHALVSPRWL